MIEDFFRQRDWFDIDLGLERIKAALEKLGSPEKDLRFIHIAGTNGKGSCGAMVEAALRSAGFKTGFYSSPHLIDFGERFRVNFRAAEEAELEKFAAMIPEDIKLTYFEFATVLAVLYFRAAGCDFAVWECGMGGRLDATNAVVPEAAVITNIALDHQKYLGDTIEKIAAEKAGIIKDGVPVFAGIMPDEAAEVIERAAAEKKAPFHRVTEYAPEGSYRTLPDGTVRQCFDWLGKRRELALPGRMQRMNFALAAEVISFLSGKYGFSLEKALAGVENARWPGRITIFGNTVVDGAHNSDGASMLVKSLQEIYPGEKFTVMFGAFKDKCVEESLKMLSEIAEKFVFVPLPAADASRECYLPEELGRMTSVPFSADAADFERAPGRRAVAGSLYLAGDYLKKHPECRIK